MFCLFIIVAVTSDDIFLEALSEKLQHETISLLQNNPKSVSQN